MALEPVLGLGMALELAPQLLPLKPVQGLELELELELELPGRVLEPT